MLTFVWPILCKLRKHNPQELVLRRNNKVPSTAELPATRNILVTSSKHSYAPLWKRVEVCGDVNSVLCNDPKLLCANALKVLAGAKALGIVTGYRININLRFYPFPKW